MKVPYLKSKAKADMLRLSKDLSGSVLSSLENEVVENRVASSAWVSGLYPVFSLLKILDDSKLALNPSREYAMAGAAADGDRSLFLRAISSYQEEAGTSAAMRRAYRATIFSGFISELRSDLILVLMQGLVYSYRGMAIGLRCALEDLYRHLYYMDHPQEYLSLVSGESEYSMKLAPKDFRQYLTRTSYLKGFALCSTEFIKKTKPEDCDWFGINESLYHDLSAAVHGASGRWFAGLENAESLKINLAKEKEMNLLVDKFSSLCTVFLVSAHRELFASASDYDKSIVLSVFGDEQKHSFRRYMNI